jgi:hypothetical protein
VVQTGSIEPPSVAKYTGVPSGIVALLFNWSAKRAVTITSVPSKFLPRGLYSVTERERLFWSGTPTEGKPLGSGFAPPLPPELLELLLVPPELLVLELLELLVPPELLLLELLLVPPELLVLVELPVPPEPLDPSSDSLHPDNPPIISRTASKSNLCARIPKALLIRINTLYHTLSENARSPVAQKPPAIAAIPENRTGA